jgi:hypothetical protein
MLDLILFLADLQGTSMHSSSEAYQHTDMPWRRIPALRANLHNLKKGEHGGLAPPHPVITSYN